MNSISTWHFPLPRVHTGPLLGNGQLGVMVWGGESVLRVTLGRGDLWDHRGGGEWTTAMTYASLRECLEAGDEERLKSLFAARASVAGLPKNPSVVPIGRIELDFGAGFRLVRADLAFGEGKLTVSMTGDDGSRHEITLHLDRDAPLLQIGFSEGCPAPLRSLVPAWHHMEEYLRSISFPPPVIFREESGGVTREGWCQEMPADPPCVVALAASDNALHITAVHGAGARELADGILVRASARPVGELPERVAAWWREYWNGAPEVDIPNERLRFLYEYGLWKLAGLWHPSALPPGLQGSWVEDYQFPPWSNDYHFNINMQMCCWPAFASGKAEMLRPLFELVWSWRDKLRENARRFVGIDDGYVLPHAVDDRCTIIGVFWTGMIDHACTIWVGLLMMDYWRHTGDRNFLRERAFPFLKGAMRVCEKLLDPKDGGFSLPVSVSPEFNGSEMNAWGRNASFQLGAYHALLRALREACNELGEHFDPVWEDIENGLSVACIEGEGSEAKIMLWEGQDLTYSHRHHSHWGALYPWDLLEPTDPRWAPVLAATYNQWNAQGMGHWSGWCMPWAAMLHARIGSPDLTEGILEIWERIFTNEGHGTLHDGNYFARNVRQRKLSPPEVPYVGRQNMGEFIQIEAGMAACAAVMDMLAQTRVGIVWLFEGVPAHWRKCGFSGLHVPGGFVLGARWEDGAITSLHIRSRYGGTLRFSGRKHYGFPVPAPRSFPYGASGWEITLEPDEVREFGGWGSSD